MYMHTEAVKAGAKAAAIACVASAIPTVSLIVNAPINLYRFNSVMTNIHIHEIGPGY
jgi:hypothetical protein